MRIARGKIVTRYTMAIGQFNQQYLRDRRVL